MKVRNLRIVMVMRYILPLREGGSLSSETDNQTKHIKK